MDELLRVGPATGLALLLASGVLIAVIGDWHLALIGLILEYLGVAALIVTVTSNPLLWLLLVIGALAAVILYLGKRGEIANRAGLPPALGISGAPFRNAAFLLIILVTVIAALLQPLPFAGTAVSLACYWLLGMFAACATLFQEPVRAGMGLLALLNAVALYEQAVEGSLVVFAWIVAVHLLTAMAASYLQFSWGATAPTDGDA